MISTAVTRSAKQEFLRGVHQEGDIYKIALYTSKAVLGADTTEYSPTNEVTGKGYEPGGKILSGYKVLEENGVAIMTFASPNWPDSSITARGAMIYNANKSNRALCIFDFGEVVTSTNGDFTAKIPPATAKEGLIKLI